MASTADNHPSMRRRRIALAVVVAIVLAALLAAWLLTRHAPAPDGLLQINGRIEGERITLAPKFAGRVTELAAREGDTVSCAGLGPRCPARRDRSRGPVRPDPGRWA